MEFFLRHLTVFLTRINKKNMAGRARCHLKSAHEPAVDNPRDAELQNECTARVELLYASIRIRHINIAGRIDCDAPGSSELAMAVAGSTPLQQEVAGCRGRDRQYRQRSEQPQKKRQPAMLP